MYLKESSLKEWIELAKTRIWTRDLWIKNIQRSTTELSWRGVFFNSSNIVCVGVCMCVRVCVLRIHTWERLLLWIVVAHRWSKGTLVWGNVGLGGGAPYALYMVFVINHKKSNKGPGGWQMLDITFYARHDYLGTSRHVYKGNPE